MSSRPEIPHDKEIDPKRYALSETGDGTAAGNFNDVVRMRGSLGGKIVRLMRRKPRGAERETPEAGVPADVAMRARLLQAGVPVIPTYRRGENGERYSTDLTKGGQNFVVSWQNTPFDVEEIDEHIYRPVPLAAPNRAEVLATLRDICRRCTDEGLLIENADGLFLVIDKATHRTSVLAGDYKHFHPRPALKGTSELMNYNLANCKMLVAYRQNRQLLGFTQAELDAFFKEQP